MNLNDLGGYGGVASLQGVTTGMHFNYARLGYVAQFTVVHPLVRSRAWFQVASYF